MDSKSFFDYVAKMREAQRAYFKTKRHDYLVKAKRMEKIVDDEIVRVHGILEKKNNPQLF